MLVFAFIKIKTKFFFASHKNNSSQNRRPPPLLVGGGGQQPALPACEGAMPPLPIIRVPWQALLILPLCSPGFGCDTVPCLSQSPPSLFFCFFFFFLLLLLFIVVIFFSLVLNCLLSLAAFSRAAFVCSFLIDAYFFLFYFFCLFFSFCSSLFGFPIITALREVCAIMIVGDSALCLK